MCADFLCIRLYSTHSVSVDKSPTVTMPSAIDSSDSLSFGCPCCNNCSPSHRNYLSALLRKFHASCSLSRNPWSTAYFNTTTLIKFNIPLSDLSLKIKMHKKFTYFSLTLGIRCGILLIN